MTFYKTDLAYSFQCSLSKQKRSKLVQAAPPGLPFVSRTRRHIESALDVPPLRMNDMCARAFFSSGVLSKMLFAFLLLCLCDHALAEQVPSNSIPILTVCEALHNRAMHNGKPIVVIGRIVSTKEGTWLSEECKTKISTDGVLWGGDISLTVYLGRAEPPPKLPKDFSWDDRKLLEKLKSLEDYSHYHNIFSNWAAVFGSFETRISPEYFRDEKGRLRGLGFGHLGFSLAQLVSGSDGFHVLKEKESGLTLESNDSSDQAK